MIGKKVLETDPITNAEVKEMLEERSKTVELSYEQNLALDHVTKFTKLDAEAAVELVKELEEIIKKTQSIKLVDIMPKDMADMRLMFAKERGSHKKEEMETLLEILNKYRGEE
ncbi:MAG TPA: RNA polymerase Rpb4 family protein [Methanobacterium sp.]|nr:RNA polymerase Rpb4 family protein [Methanobacterium sp.]